MQKFGEYGVEQDFMDWLEEAGWNVFGEPKNNVNGASILDERYDRELSEVVYWDLLKEKLVEINDELTDSDAAEIIEKLKRRLGSDSLLDANKDFYSVLRDGVPHTPKEGEETKYYDLIDLPEDGDLDKDYILENNSFVAVNQFRVKRGEEYNIPDVTLLVNGVPLVHVELKSIAQGTTVFDAIEEMQDYEDDIPRMFASSVFNVVCDGEKFRYAGIEASEEFYFPWRPEEDNGYEARDAVQDLLDPGTLMDVFKYFVFFEDNAKIVPRYMQYQATNRIVNRVRNDEVRKGLIWHTQGSGKSYSMLFTGYKLKKHPAVEDRQVLLIVDRKKLEEQMEDTLHEIDYPLFEVAKKIKHLEDILENGKSQMVLTTIQKFEDVNAVSDEESVVLVDEAHRFTEGKLGSRLKAAVPNSFYFGFTGTPVAEGESPEDRNTFREFSPEGEEYLHRYSIKQGQEDKVITEVSFTLREIEWEVPEEKIDTEFEGEFGNLPLERRREILKEYVNQAELSELRPRVEKVVADIEEHYRKRVEPLGFKGMVVTPSRRAAALYADELRKYRDPEEVEAVISAQGDDPEEMQKYHKSNEEERNVVEEFKDVQGDLKILVVCSKLLTGFDAPILKTMYLDKEMKNHNLLQAIARVNRPMESKKNGEIVDYQGIFANPEEALDYSLEFVENVAFDTDELAEDFLELLDELIDLFDDINFDGSSHEFRNALSKLQRNDELASKFLQTYKEADQIFASVTPHEKLGQKEILKKWEVMEQIYHGFMRLRRGDNPGNSRMKDDVREKTRNILEENIGISIGEEVNIDYDLKDPELQKVRQEEPEWSAAAEGALLEKNIEIKRDENPVYPKLSQRVREVIQKWKNEEISSEEALEEFNRIEERKDNLNEEQSNLGLNDVEYSVFKLIEQDYSEHVDEYDEILEVSKLIGNSVNKIGKTGRISEVIREIRETLIMTLAKEGYSELLKAEDRKFLDEAPEYIYENKDVV